MYSRGPYKRYRIDLESVVPRRTDYYNRREVRQQIFQNGELPAGAGDVEDIINHDVPVSVVLHTFDNSAVPPFYVFSF